MITTLIPHLTYRPRKGAWWRGKGKTLWGCPDCGQPHELSTHGVQDDGQVFPSVVYGKCGFHDYVTLDEVSPECVTKRTDGYGDPAKGEYNAFLADDGGDIPCD